MVSRIWPVFIEGRWWKWTPLPGQDPSLANSVYWIGAVQWAKSRIEGKPESIAQQEAEKTMYAHAHGVKYMSNNFRMKV
jgi:hypothetical protein